MGALISALFVVTLSLLITRIATVALTLTGLSRQAASFQARSAFTGVGFTTNEAEQMVNHPVRRRIVMLLMLLGNAGLISAISSLLLTFLNRGTSQSLLRLGLLGLGLAGLWGLATSNWVDRYLSRLIRWALQRWTRLEIRDYAHLLHLTGNYTVMELEVQPDDWLANRKLSHLNLDQEGVVVLGIRRQNGRYVGAPKGDTSVRPGDTLILYGRSPVLADLDERCVGPSGEYSHRQAVANQQRLIEKQDRQEAAEG